jgi:thymidylate kinase
MTSELVPSRPGLHPIEPGLEARRPRADNPRGRLLEGVLQLFDRQQIPYCILHGADEYPARVASDVDFIMPPEYLPRSLGLLLQADRASLGASVVQLIRYKSTAYCYVLAADRPGAEREFLAVDVCSDYRGYGRLFYRGERILESRRLERGYWVPSPALEFTCYLIKRVGKVSLWIEHGPRLTELYRQDPLGCDRELARFWPGANGRRIGRLTASGQWDALRNLVPALRRELLWPHSRGEWKDTAVYWVTDTLRRVERWRTATGLHIVLLGPDGSGKSVSLAALARAVAPAFRRVRAHHFSPALFRRTEAYRAVTAPHAHPPRSLLGSLAKAIYWFFDFTVGYYGKVRPELARAALVLFDRYLLDALVDPRRYRYAGPAGLLRRIWLLVPKPDLVILLDAPSDVLRARKQEVAVAEVDRQREAYRRLLQSLPNGHVVDASRPSEEVVEDLATIVLGHLEARIEARWSRPGTPRQGRPGPGWPEPTRTLISWVTGVMM